jgi:hypothetical protein
MSGTINTPEIPNTPRIIGPDKRVPRNVEVNIKAEITSRNLPSLIDELSNSSDGSEKQEELKEKIFSRAKRVHDILESNEP